MSDKLIVKMLGSFSIALGSRQIDDQANRMRKVWLLLAYLIYSRNSRLSQENFANLLQGGNEDSGDLNGRVKAMFYRARTMLNQLDENAGHDLIIRRGGNYAWNTDIPVELDVERFEKLCKEATFLDGQTALDLRLQALELYQGDFLSKLSMEAWVIPISAYYHQLYLDTAEAALSALEEAGQWSQALELCQKALKIEPYSESLYQHLMRCRITLGDGPGAVRAYEEMSELLFSTFGVMPSEESRQLYRAANRETGSSTVPIGTVRENLREVEAPKGALYCEYDFFKMLYQVQARAIARSGEVIHIALFSVHGHRNKSLPRRSLDTAMENLQELIIGNLRQGDVVSRCSISQLIVMLPQANYENSCAVCDRIIRAFFRKYPHSPADIHHSVQPLEPVSGSMPGTKN